MASSSLSGTQSRSSTPSGARPDFIVISSDDDDGRVWHPPVSIKSEPSEGAAVASKPVEEVKNCATNNATYNAQVQRKNHW